MISRRFLFLGAAAFVAAPSIVRASALMQPSRLAASRLITLTRYNLLASLNWQVSPDGWRISMSGDFPSLADALHAFRRSVLYEPDTLTCTQRDARSVWVPA